MLMIDQVSQSRTGRAVFSSEPGVQWSIPSASEYAEKVAQCAQRYVLSDEVETACRSFVDDQPQLLAGALDFVRLPSEVFWVEWAEPAAKEKQLARRRRIGLLVSCDTAGRAGTVRAFWSGSVEGEIDVSPALLRFDFDNSPAKGDGSFTLNLLDPSPINAILQCVSATLDQRWIEYYQASAGIQAQYFMKQAASMSARDVPMLVAFAVLLASRQMLSIKPSDLARLNVSRKKSNKLPLNEHLVVSLAINEAREQFRSRSPSESAPARLHSVRGHFVRRANSIFWRRPHFRGSLQAGSIKTKTSIVRLGG